LNRARSRSGLLTMDFGEVFKGGEEILIAAAQSAASPRSYKRVHDDAASTIVSMDIMSQVLKSFHSLTNVTAAISDAADFTVNAKAQHRIKMSAFTMAANAFVDQFGVSIEPGSLLYLKETLDEVVVPENVCNHALIGQVARMVQVLLRLQTAHAHVFFVFLPYLKQLKRVMDFFRNDACCRRAVRANTASLDAMLADGLKALAVVECLDTCVRGMGVFADRPVVECNICRDMFAEERYMKPDECCGYRICYSCYANLWRHCSVYPVCPVCKTSFGTKKVRVE
jgi:Baculovirus immediate-early protein (IE-0)